jgi:hypothetical protein
VKSNFFDGGGVCPPTSSPAKARRQSVAEILREAYQIHGRDTLTRRAVKRVLR